ncbi:DNA-binding protein [Bacillus sp. JCM 19046]|nr:DNA-binding protein [Bacillus sp. JCM 19045]GAF15779.1 DNA-binding protein [Bacillus sp. JCM 19046]
MDAYVTKQIGETIKHQRLLKGMTIEAFAKQIDISKLTLIKIERGDGNPTLSVIWKIANGLQVPVASLLATNNEVEISRKKARLALTNTEETFIAEPIFQQKEYELYRGYMKANCDYQSEAHAPGVTECITVMSGELIIALESGTHHLYEHDAIRFNGNQIHRYINPTKVDTTLHFVISY